MLLLIAFFSGLYRIHLLIVFIFNYIISLGDFTFTLLVIQRILDFSFWLVQRIFLSPPFSLYCVNSQIIVILLLQSSYQSLFTFLYRIFLKFCFWIVISYLLIYSLIIFYHYPFESLLCIFLRNFVYWWCFMRIRSPIVRFWN